MNKFLMILGVCAMVSCDGVYSVNNHPFKHEIKMNDWMMTVYNVQSYVKEGDFFKLTFVDGEVIRVPVSDVKSIKDY